MPTRVATEDDVALVHDTDFVYNAISKYPSDEAATAALGLDSDTYFSGSASGYATLLAAGSVTELTTRVAQGDCAMPSPLRALEVICETRTAMGRSAQ